MPIVEAKLNLHDEPTAGGTEINFFLILMNTRVVSHIPKFGDTPHLPQETSSISRGKYDVSPKFEICDNAGMYYIFIFI